MLALLRKDLRLSLDMLLPTALVVVGFAVALLVASWLPASMVPAAVSKLSFNEILMILAVGLGLFASPLAAWAVVAVVQGDRVHGAEILAATLPVRPSKLLASKLVAIVVAAGAAPLMVVTAVAACAFFSPSTFSLALDKTQLAWLSAVTAFLGGGLALAVAPLVRGAFKVVAVALLLGAVAAVVGFLGSRASFWWFARDYTELAGRWASSMPWTKGDFDWYLSAVASRSTLLAASVAVPVVGAACWLIGAASLARRLTPRTTCIAIALSLLCGVGAGVIATANTAPGDLSRQFPRMEDQIFADQASDAEIAAVIGQWVSDGHANKWVWQRRIDRSSVREDTMINEGRDRLRKMSAAARRDSPMTMAFQPIRDDWARDCNPNVPHWYLVDDDDRLRIALECLLGSPQDERQHVNLMTVLLSLDPSLTFAPTSLEDREFRRARIAAIVDGLRTRLASGHGDEELLQRAIDALTPQLRAD